MPFSLSLSLSLCIYLSIFPFASLHSQHFFQARSQRGRGTLQGLRRKVFGLGPKLKRLAAGNCSATQLECANSVAPIALGRTILVVMAQANQSDHDHPWVKGLPPHWCCRWGLAFWKSRFMVPCLVSDHFAWSDTPGPRRVMSWKSLCPLWWDHCWRTGATNPQRKIDRLDTSYRYT